MVDKLLNLFQVQSRSLEDDPRVKRSPEDWTDTVKGAFDKAREGVSDAVDKVKGSDAYSNVKEGLQNVGDKLSEIGQNIKNSDAYEKVSSEIHHAGEVLSNAGQKIKETSQDTIQGVKSGIDKAKDKLDDW